MKAIRSVLVLLACALIILSFVISEVSNRKAVQASIATRKASIITTCSPEIQRNAQMIAQFNELRQRFIQKYKDGKITFDEMTEINTRIDENIKHLEENSSEWVKLANDVKGQ